MSQDLGVAASLERDGEASDASELAGNTARQSGRASVRPSARPSARPSGRYEIGDGAARVEDDGTGEILSAMCESLGLSSDLAGDVDRSLERGAADDE